MIIIIIIMLTINIIIINIIIEIILLNPQHLDVDWTLSGPSLRTQMQQLVVAERSEPGPRLGEAGTWSGHEGQVGGSGGGGDQGHHHGVPDRGKISVARITKIKSSINSLDTTLQIERTRLVRQILIKVDIPSLQPLNCEHFFSLESPSLPL